MRRFLRRAYDAARRLGPRQSEERIARDSRSFWNESGAPYVRRDSHWREGLGDEVWLALGGEHLALFERLVRVLDEPPRRRCAVEWGVGGGANARWFAPSYETFYGVDISQASLDECGRQMRDARLANFVPLHFEIDRPEAAADRLAGLCDLYLCTYVFELLPGKAYGRRLLRVAADLLAPGGVAFVQIKYATDARRTFGRRRAYRLNVADMTAYRIEEFWEMASECGLGPRTVSLVPRQPLVADERYAYFLLQKAPASAEAAAPRP